GKPVGQGGIRGRREATGLGIFYGVRHALTYEEACKKWGMKPGIKGKRIVIQGLGNVGYNAAKFFHEAGAIITAIAEYNSAIYSEKGINPDEAIAYFKEKGTLEGLKGSKSFKKPADALEFECDILVPAALENQIHA